MISFSDIQDAFLFVSSAPYGEHSALVCKDTGEILYRSEMGGIDEIGDEDRDPDKWAEVPHKNDLDLGYYLSRGQDKNYLGETCQERGG